MVLISSEQRLPTRTSSATASHQSLPEIRCTRWVLGYIATAGDPLVAGSRSLGAFVSSTHAEFRALVEGARAVAQIGGHRNISDVHVRGDAAAVIKAVDPTQPETPGDEIRNRRVALVHDALARIPRVTYRRVGRRANERAHRLATRAHGPSPTD